MKKLCIIFILMTSCYNSENNITLPFVTPKDCDTIMAEQSITMLRSIPIVYAINVKDSLNMNFEVKYKSSDYTDDGIPLNSHDSIKVFVDNTRIKFHTDEFDILSFPPPPPPLPIIQDSILNLNDETNPNDHDSLSINKYENKLLEKLEKRSKIHFKTFPVYVYNYGKEETIIQKPIAGDLFMLLEAKDKNEEWKPIEYLKQYSFLCGTGHEDYRLKPKHFIFSTVKRYEGNYKTKLRVKLMSFNKIYYSNTFEGHINYSQFDSEPIVNQTKSNFKYKDSITLIRKLNGLFLTE
ncbi:hypothetical protein ADIWIN_1722 [Winogradskyella psychrotolerans RS-3]|uniref:Uncharacterized protein n=1 Tax=Winogradskyella psychrotolerans RS-3 TaxID=641526 RepID=S7VTA9_9FLAO|nr:hypothetical protein [Winogradskyella psychrotolerans]EPR73291.1 hypothetical protein ADIWIN_1722 [Winogradskyella psychrotolerans RS-3]